MKATLIISVYNAVDSLRAVLRSAMHQTEQDFEIIVSQDSEENCFDEVITEFSSRLKITHLQQPDNGKFLKTRMLNKCIRTSKSDRLIFIDGDCVLHRRFVEQYVKAIVKGRFCAGRRVDLDEKTSASIKNGERITPSFIQMIRNKSLRVEDSIYVLRLVQRKLSRLIGCNMGWYKEDLIRLNGFDETYETPGFGEDSDIEFRAKKAGIQPFSVRYRAIEFHLAHERPDREQAVTISRNLFLERQGRADFRCQFGLETLPE